MVFFLVCVWNVMNHYESSLVEILMTYFVTTPADSLIGSVDQAVNDSTSDEKTYCKTLNLAFFSLAKLLIIQTVSLRWCTNRFIHSIDSFLLLYLFFFICFLSLSRSLSQSLFLASSISTVHCSQRFFLHTICTTLFLHRSDSLFFFPFLLTACDLFFLIFPDDGMGNPCRNVETTKIKERFWIKRNRLYY